MSARRAEDRRLIAKIAANTRHAHSDGREVTRAARYAANVTRFERLVDPDGVLSPAERTRRADAARRAYFQGLALKSAQARRKRAGSPKNGSIR